MFPWSRYLIAVYGFSELIILGKLFLFSFWIRFLIVPEAIIPSIFIFFNSLSTLSTRFGLAIEFIYSKETPVSVYLPSLYFLIHRSLLFILLLIRPILFSIFSVKESKAPREVFSVVGVVIPRDRSFFVSRAIYLPSDINKIVKPLFR